MTPKQTAYFPEDTRTNVTGYSPLHFYKYLICKCLPGSMPVWFLVTQGGVWLPNQ